MADEIKKGCEMPEYITDIGRIVRYPWPHVGREIVKSIPKGYVYAIRESGSNMVFIGWGGKTTMRETIVHLQKGNPRPLTLLKMLLRYNIHDANIVCKTLCMGLSLYHTRGNWYDVDQKTILRIFNSIDPLHEHSENLISTDVYTNYAARQTGSPANSLLLHH